MEGFILLCFFYKDIAPDFIRVDIQGFDRNIIKKGHKLHLGWGDNIII